MYIRICNYARNECIESRVKSNGRIIRDGDLCGNGRTGSCSIRRMNLTATVTLDSACQRLALGWSAKVGLKSTTVQRRITTKSLESVPRQLNPSSSSPIGGPVAAVTAEVERRRPGWKEGSRGSRPVTTSVTAAVNRGSRHVGQQDNRFIEVESCKLAIPIDALYIVYVFAPSRQKKEQEAQPLQRNSASTTHVFL